MNIKAALLLASSLFSFHAFADNCIAHLCVGDKVIDQSDYAGIVVKVDSETGEAVYTRDGYYGQVKDYATKLSDEINSSEFPSGKTVLDEAEYIGTVKTAFRNGKVLYSRNGYYGNVVSRNLSPSVEQLGDFQVRSRVIDSSNYVGVAQWLFKNGKIAYGRDGYHGTVISNKLSVGVSVLEQFSAGKRLIDASNYIGTVKEVFADGRISYSRDGYYGNVIAHKQNLSVGVGNVGTFKKGVTIIDRSDYIGIVSECFEDQRIIYSRNGYHGTTSASAGNLSAEVPALGVIKSGVLVVDSSNYAGIVDKTFDDGRISYKRNGYYGSVIARDLSPAVDTHKLYSKDQKYSTDSMFVGKPQAFFANGKVLIGNSVFEKLHSRVDQLGSVAVDDEVLSLNAKFYKVAELYENSVAVVQLENNNDLAMRLVTLEQIIDQKNAVDKIISELFSMTQFENFIPRIAFVKNEAAEIKKLLVAEVDKKEGLSKEEKKKMFMQINLLNASIEPTPPADPTPVEKIFALSVTPADLAEIVKGILTAEGKNFSEVSVEKAKVAPHAVIVLIDKKLLSASCEILVKEDGRTVKKITKKIKKNDVESCIDELKN